MIYENLHKSFSGKKVMRKKILFSCLVVSILISGGRVHPMDDIRLTPELRNHSVIALLIDSADGAIVDANNAAASFYGYTVESLRQMHIQDINVLEPREVEAEFGKARDANRNYFLFPHRLADGNVRTVEVYSSPFTSRNENPLLLSIIHDATDKVLLNEELHHYQTRLETLVETRTRELLQANDRIKWITIFGVTIIFGLAFIMFQRHQQAAFFRRQYELEHERKTLLQRFEDLTRYANDMILLVDDHGAIADVNERAVLAYGFSREQLLCMNIRDIHDPETNMSFKEIKNSVIENNGLIYESMHLRRDGTSFPVEASIRYIKTGDQSFSQHIIRDITERKQAAEALRKSEERFQKMLSLIPDMISIQDADLNIVYSNWKGFAAVDEEKRILGTKCYSTYRGYDQVCPDCRPISVFSSRKAFQEEVEMPGGIWLDMRVIPIPDPDGSVGYFVEWARDITEQKQAAENLLHQKNLLEGIIDAVPDILSIQRPDHTVEHYNRAGCEMIGLTHEDARNKKCYQLIGRDRECEQCATSEAIKTGRLAELEKYVPELGMYLHCRSNPIHDQNGNIVRIVEQLRDITENQAAKKKLKLLATTDDLTGLWNRRHFMSMLSREVDRAHRYQEIFSVLLIDIDDFKQINDTYGHAAGDAVLVHFGKTIRAGLRQPDIAGRLGGEEFSILLPKTDLDEAVLLAERLRAAIETTPAICLEKEIRFTASIGIAVYHRDYARSDGGSELLAAADRALYEAKKNGKNRYAIGKFRGAGAAAFKARA